MRPRWSKTGKTSSKIDIASSTHNHTVSNDTVTMHYHLPMLYLEPRSHLSRPLPFNHISKSESESSAFRSITYRNPNPNHLPSVSPCPSHPTLTQPHPASTPSSPPSSPSSSSQTLHPHHPPHSHYRPLDYSSNSSSTYLKVYPLSHGLKAPFLHPARSCSFHHEDRRAGPRIPRLGRRGGSGGSCPGSWGCIEARGWRGSG